ncbi:hypothetical protein B0H10DRAFT_1960590 [Mycena sp. CBHHK59/15]|nr:hypothetical protein B0H10DRAFT_1960590 [Mycena sp. CBHHK59/15]
MTVGELKAGNSTFSVADEMRTSVKKEKSEKCSNSDGVGPSRLDLEKMNRLFKLPSIVFWGCITDFKLLDNKISTSRVDPPRIIPKAVEEPMPIVQEEGTAPVEVEELAPTVVAEPTTPIPILALAARARPERHIGKHRPLLPQHVPPAPPAPQYRQRAAGDDLSYAGCWQRSRFLWSAGASPAIARRGEGTPISPDGQRHPASASADAMFSC